MALGIVVACFAWSPKPANACPDDLDRDLSKILDALDRLSAKMTSFSINITASYACAAYTVFDPPGRSNIMMSVKPKEILLHSIGFTIAEPRAERECLYVFRRGEPPLTYDFAERSVRVCVGTVDMPAIHLPQDISVFEATTHFAAGPLAAFLRYHCSPERHAAIERREVMESGESCVQLRFMPKEKERHTISFALKHDYLPVRKTSELLIDDRWQVTYEIRTVAVQNTRLGSFPKEVDFQYLPLRNVDGARARPAPFSITHLSIQAPSARPSDEEWERRAIAYCTLYRYLPINSPQSSIDTNGKASNNDRLLLLACQWILMFRGAVGPSLGSPWILPWTR